MRHRPVVEKLPFADATFEVALSSVMFHHLPDDSLEQGLREIRRVLKPSGRLLVIDCGGVREHRHTAARQRNHAYFDLANIVPKSPALDSTE
jgi:ubiquinone/menaquinone biosynthesis C-methylase UbiE